MKLGIDPGRYKIGVALLENDKLIFSAIVPKSEEGVLYRAIEDRNFTLLDKWKKENEENKNSPHQKLEYKKLIVLIGNGTSHSEIKEKIKTTQDTEIKTVNEYGTTLKGRNIYWEIHPPKGLWKLIPTSLRTPPRDIDDLAAYAIALASTETK
ncbi:MAG: hypothetical protein RR272_02965 [Synergistaceae bacterium]